MLIKVENYGYINAWISDNPAFSPNCDSVVGYEVLDSKFNILDGGEYDYNHKDYFMPNKYGCCENENELIKFVQYVSDNEKISIRDFEVLSATELGSIEGEEKENMQVYAMNVIQNMIDASKIPWTIYSNGDNTILPMLTDKYLRNDDTKILTDDGEYVGYISIPEDELLLWDEEEQTVYLTDPIEIKKELIGCSILDEMNGTNTMINFVNDFFDNNFMVKDKGKELE